MAICPAPFVLLDDARASGAGDTLLFERPEQLFIARRLAEVEKVLEAADAARRATGQPIAGYIAYEAGLALEPRLAPRADAGIGAAGPLVWLGLFPAVQRIGATQMPGWLAGRAGDSAANTIGPLDPAITQGEYARAFSAIQEAIRAGDIYQANLTFPLTGAWRGDTMALYAALRDTAHAGHGGMIFDGSHWLLSFSPELFFALSDGQAVVKPMKGTRPRGTTAAEDNALAADLAASPKDRAENLMIVDLMRNDLSRVAMPGSVQVKAPFAVESYPSVHQMTSTIHATLAEGRGAMDLLRALFPCGSVTGAPKIRAIELISVQERAARGPYCGAMGYIDSTGDAAFNVAIRTLRLSQEENGRGRAVLGVGSAIVADSHMMPEWRECLVKGGFVHQSTAAGHDLIETMAFDPDKGIPWLEAHLERMKASAAELGFAFDRHAVRNQIQALCFELDTPAKLRLVLARSGAIALEAAALPPPLPEPVICAILPLPVDTHDWRLRHKSSDRAFYEAARKVAAGAGAAEALLIRDDGLLTEGSFTTIFVERDGILLTPPAHLGLLPGVLRRTLLDQGRAAEAELRIDDLAHGFLIGNALRGLMKAELLS